VGNHCSDFNIKSKIQNITQRACTIADGLPSIPLNVIGRFSLNMVLDKAPEDTKELLGCKEYQEKAFSLQT